MVLGSQSYRCWCSLSWYSERGESRNGYTQGASAVNKVGDIYENQNLTGSDGLPSIVDNDIIGVAVDHDVQKSGIQRMDNGTLLTTHLNPQ